jgi:protoporphyrinogen oxidase
VYAAPPPPINRLGDLIVNVRAFDSLARNVWGGDAALVTLQMDEALVRAERARLSVKKGGKTAALTTRVGAVVKIGNQVLSTFETGNSAMAKDVLSSLRTNLALMKQTLKKIVKQH